jgi:hypothetical protein
MFGRSVGEKVQVGSVKPFFDVPQSVWFPNYPLYGSLRRFAKRLSVRGSSQILASEPSGSLVTH